MMTSYVVNAGPKMKQETKFEGGETYDRKIKRQNKDKRRSYLKTRNDKS